MNPQMMYSSSFISCEQQTLPDETFEVINDQADCQIGLQIRIKVHWVYTKRLCGPYIRKEITKSDPTDYPKYCRTEIFT
jgi:hypothetical protein